jgi:DNA-binding NarL/FixJ family response regulator
MDRNVLPGFVMQIGVEISRAVENRRVFVIDSDEVTRAALQFMLHDENETHELASLAEAIAKSDGRPVDMVLLGRAILQDQGAAVLEQIAEQFPGAKVLLVADSAADMETCLQFGVAGVLAKPLTVESVCQKVDAALGRGPAFNPLRVLS